MNNQHPFLGGKGFICPLHLSETCRLSRLVPSCRVIFIFCLCHCLSTLSLVLRSLNLFLVCLDRLCHLAILCLDQYAHTLHLLESLLTISLDNFCLENVDFLRKIFNIIVAEVQFRRTSLIGFPAQSVRSSNADALDSPYLLVLNTGMSQSRQHASGRHLVEIHVIWGQFGKKMDKNERASYVMLIELIKDDEYPSDDELNKDDDVGEEEFEGNHIDKFPTCRVVRLTNENEEIAYKMPHKIEQYDSLSNDEKENMKSVYLRNDEDKKKGVKYVMRKILGFYKGCLELGPEYQTGLEESSSGTSENHGGVT
ncbi:hypothetical protein Tco_0265630 [Tanacetum coccineum]